jgi:hypothetical protein
MNHDSLAWPIIPSDVFHVLPLSNAREKKNKKKTISPPPIRIKKKNGKPSHFVSVSLYCALPVFALIVLVPLFPADYSAVSLVCVSKRSPRKKKNTLVFISKSVKCYFRIPSVTRSGREKYKMVPHESVWSRFHLQSALRDG